ncbi:hypothetical protein [Nocardioides oleivorans]|uniref:hypothetical protein n=1 Tax=Nocardioides oleivorans TaxID=273676 RepID=UPI0013ED0EEF|nr:hypothetical protein [Nocardioides oleivorans]
MTPIVIVVIVVLVVLAGALVLGQRTRRRTGIERSEEVRTQAATDAAASVPQAQEHAAVAEARADDARAEADAAEARAARAEVEAEQARVAAQQAEAAHEDQVREADQLDPRVDETADDYAPQVPSSVDQQPAPPPPATEVATDPAPELAPEHAPEAAPEHATEAAPEAAPEAEADRTPLLPRRTPGAQEMPGKPIEQTDAGGGWFTKPSSPDSTRDDTRS